MESFPRDFLRFAWKNRALPEPKYINQFSVLNIEESDTN
jgi:hypothetical protein